VNAQSDAEWSGCRSAADRGAPQGVRQGGQAQGEEHKIAIRNERRDAKELIEEAVKEGELTEDDGKKALEKVQTEVDNGVKKVDEVIGSRKRT